MRLSVAMRGLLAALLLCLLPAAASRAATVLRVAYAGSMGVVMDRYLGPAFAQAEGIDYQGIGQGAYGLARLLAAKALRADVFVSITPGPIVVLQQAGLIDRAVPIASTQMVIAYSPRSRFAPMLRAAAQGRRPWWQVLQTPGLRFGRTDPAVDPQGQNIIFTMLLAERFYHQSDLVQRILGSVQNPAQIFTEPSLLSRLQAGQLDAASSYRSAAISHHLPYIPLPDAINLSDPARLADASRLVQLTIRQPDGKPATLHPEPLVFYAAVLKNAVQPQLAQAFVAFLRSARGQVLLRAQGYGSAPDHAR